MIESNPAISQYMHKYITQCDVDGVESSHMFTSILTLCRSTSETLLDFVFPLSKRLERVRTYTPDALHARPQTHDADGTKITTLANYHEGKMEDLIRALKYEKSAHAARLLAQLLADYLLDVTSEESLFSNRTIVITPMPLAPQRLRERGYNQIQLVLDQSVVRESGLTVHSDLLMRVRETTPQTRLSRYERLKNMKGAFDTTPQTDFHSLHIFLIDDVTTTGATLTEAARVLEKSGAKVTPLAIAHA